MSTHKDLSKPTKSPMIETCHLGEPDNPVEEMACNELSYIHEHLPTLAFIVKEFHCKSILEIGTGPGESTTALSLGQKSTVTTLDVEKCEEAKSLIKKLKLDNQVTFRQTQSDKFEDSFAIWDLILIDGGHSYEQVWKDLIKFSKYVSIGGFLILHDSTNPAWPGVKQAIKEFSFDNFKKYQWFNCNGLVVFRREY